MVIAMFLAHLVGDYVLQWDSLAEWKAREFRGVVIHSLILAIVTALFALPFDPTWWIGILLISLSHFLVDGVQFFFRPRINPLLRFFLDQSAHFFFIILALVLGGYLAWDNIWGGIVTSAFESPLLTAATGYAFITMPAWVLLKFLAYGLAKGQAPNFPAGPNKFVGIAERLIIATLVMFGQFLLVPLVALPRLIVEWPEVTNKGGDNVYMIELVSSIILAVSVGLGLSLLQF
jgi:hypothetical protein